MNIEMITKSAEEIHDFVSVEITKLRKNVKVKTKVCETSGWVSVCMSYGKVSMGSTLLRFSMFESGSDSVKKENVLETLVNLVDTCFRLQPNKFLAQSVAFAVKKGK